MQDTTISVRVDEVIHKQMRVHEDINWSAVLRQSLVKKLEQLETIDYDRAQHGAKRMDALRKAKTFDHGKQVTEFIREWREKRK